MLTTCVDAIITSMSLSLLLHTLSIGVGWHQARAGGVDRTQAGAHLDVRHTGLQRQLRARHP